MTKQLCKKEKSKLGYQKPRISRIKVDNQISMVMMSAETPPGDPYDRVSTNPFK